MCSTTCIVMAATVQLYKWWNLLSLHSGARAWQLFLKSNSRYVATLQLVASNWTTPRVHIVTSIWIYHPVVALEIEGTVVVCVVGNLNTQHETISSHETWTVDINFTQEAKEAKEAAPITLQLLFQLVCDQGNHGLISFFSISVPQIKWKKLVATNTYRGMLDWKSNVSVKFLCHYLQSTSKLKCR